MWVNSKEGGREREGEGKREREREGGSERVGKGGRERRERECGLVDEVVFARVCLRARANV